MPRRPASRSAESRADLRRERYGYESLGRRRMLVRGSAEQEATLERPPLSTSSSMSGDLLDLVAR